ncbi:MAG: hypothetical protein D6698_10975 [Gammaproteobacteria bacterium]|nr:MAG: hypothetical protein D6698_10975 [Gammaproteobacteria bacterium]
MAAQSPNTHTYGTIGPIYPKITIFENPPLFQTKTDFRKTAIQQPQISLFHTKNRPQNAPVSREKGLVLQKSYDIIKTTDSG